jgi:oligoendopeptidase F
LELVDRPLDGAEELESWVVDWSSWVGEVRAWWRGRRAVPETRLEAARQVNEALQPLHLRIARRLVEHPAARLLPGEEFAQLLARTRADVDLYAPELQLLRSQESGALLEVESLVVGTGLVFRGQRLPLPMVEGMLESLNPGRREEAWWTLGAHHQRSRHSRDKLLDELLGIRSKLAHAAGVQGYPAFRWLEQRNFAWGPHQARALINSVARVVTPRLRRWQELVRKSHGLERLRPWDSRLEPGGALAALHGPDDLARRSLSAFDRVHPAFGSWFQLLLDQGLADLRRGPQGSRKSWQAHGTTHIPTVRVPFTGRHDDVVRVFHEGGHAFHALARRGQRLVQNRGAPVAFAEVASHAMELIGSQHLEGTLYDRHDAILGQLRALGRVVRMLCGLARVEAFQFWLHDHPHHGPRAREAAWSKLRNRFDGDLDWSGLDRARGRGYLAHSALWRDPFGQLPYAVALVGALQVWDSYGRDPQATLKRYLGAMSLGWSQDLGGLFRAAGLQLDLTAGLLEQLMQHWDHQVEQLARQLDRVSRSPSHSRAPRFPSMVPA